MRSAELHVIVKLKVEIVVLVQSNCRNRKAAPMRLALRNFLSSNLITTDASGINCKSSNSTSEIQSISSYRNAYIVLTTSSPNTLYKRRTHHKRGWLILPLLLFLFTTRENKRDKRKTSSLQKHTTGGIPRWSPTLVLVARFSAYVWQSGRDAQFSLTYGRMC